MRIKWPQPINPLIMMNRAGHRVFQRIAPGKLAHAAAGGDQPCFFVVSVSVGDPNPDQFRVCFNTTPGETECLTTDFTFENVTRATVFTTSFAQAGPGNCLDYEAGFGTEVNSSGPLDSLLMDYVPGVCRKEGSTEDECLLEAITNYSVTNNIWGPTLLRIGDIADDLLIAQFPTPPAQVGSRWQIYYDGVEQFGFTSEILADQIRFTMADPVASPSVAVTISHNAQGSFPAGTSCLAADGRACWRFRFMPVLNVSGVSFWSREDAGPWMLDSRTGRWRLEN